MNLKTLEKKLAQIPEKFRKEIARANARNAATLERAIVMRIKSQPAEWDPLHPVTVERKGHEKMLIETGTLQQAATSKKISDFETLVIINRTTKDDVNIAPVHEYGAIISVTPKMRAYLHSIGIHLKPSTKTITIPPRPFVEPAFQENLKNFEKNYLKAIDIIFRL